jgi:hypothetical protein
MPNSSLVVRLLKLLHRTIELTGARLSCVIARIHHFNQGDKAFDPFRGSPLSLRDLDLLSFRFRLMSACHLSLILAEHRKEA